MSAMLYDSLAALLRYPDRSYLGAVDACRRALEAEDPGLAEPVERFAAATGRMTVAELEELFTRTFDINPMCSLEVGWQLFGEEYARGAFLVRMRQEMRRLGLAESTELPDHLTHVLAILGRMEPDAADDFATACVLPALERMCAGLSNKDVPYEHALGAIRAFVLARHGADLPHAEPHSCDSSPRSHGDRME